MTVIYEMYFDEINAELQEMAAREAAEKQDEELFVCNRIFIGSGEDAHVHGQRSVV